MSAQPELLDDFLAFSSAITGFSEYRLRGTSQAGAYLDAATAAAGQGAIRDLLRAFRAISPAEETEIERAMRRDILSDPRLGPLTRNLIKLWYVGTWYELPSEWREAYGSEGSDRTFVVSPTAYTEGLLWPAIGANPSGAKPLGYGMWAFPPRIEE
jgi:hypothetical protein